MHYLRKFLTNMHIQTVFIPEKPNFPQAFDQNCKTQNSSEEEDEYPEYYLHKLWFPLDTQG